MRRRQVFFNKSQPIEANPPLPATDSTAQLNSALAPIPKGLPVR